MKKMLCMILALVMVFSLSISAMAADTITPVGDNGSQNVTATYNAATDATWGDTIYNVTLTWTPAGTITYTGEKGATYTWDAANTQYVVAENGNAVAADWTVSASSMKVTVTNKSNAVVKASVAATPASNLTVTGSWDKQSADVESAAPANPSATNLNGEAKIADFTYTITDVDGTPAAPAEGETTVTVATITVTLGK